MQLLGRRNRSERKRGAVPQFPPIRKPASASCCVQEQRVVERLQSDAALRGAGLGAESNVSNLRIKSEDVGNSLRSCFKAPRRPIANAAWVLHCPFSFPFPLQEPVGRWTAAGRLRQRRLSFLRRLPALVPRLSAVRCLVSQRGGQSSSPSLS